MYSVARSAVLALALVGCGQLQPITILDDPTDVVDDDFADTGSFDDPVDDPIDDPTDGTDTEPPAEPPRTPEDPPDDEPQTSAPELLSLEITDAGNGFADIAFEVADADGDLDFLRITHEGWASDLAIPGDIDEYNPGGVSHVLWEVGSPSGCGTASSFFEVRAFDQEGRPSGSLTDTVELAGGGGLVGREQEPNEFRMDATPIGGMNRPMTITGSSSGFADDDYLEFTACQGGSTTFTLTWTGSHTDIDLDLHLYNSSGSKVASAFTFGYPERLTYTLTQGTTYFLRVGAWDAAGSWTISSN